MSSFNAFSFSEPIIKAITEMGFETPTPIQEQTFQKILFTDTDFLGLAQTGTGKTAAFGLPLLEKIDTSKSEVQAVILSPTRELCQQINGQLELFSKFMKNIRIVPVFGGASITGQLQKLKKTPHIIVATPGRLIDFIKRRSIKLGAVRTLILDEADEMLNMGFKDDMDTILSYTPDEKQTWLFSATMPREIRRIVKNYMTDPEEVQVISTEKINKNIQHLYTRLRRDDKADALKRILDVNPDMHGLVFCKTRRDTVDVSKNLMKDGYRADLINGDLSQAQRDAVMEKFKAGHINVLIATDVAARGIDVNDLTHVIHYSLPDQIENYTHRSGRTARAGKKGISLSFVSGRDKSMIHRLEKMLEISFDKYEIPRYNEVEKIRMKNWISALFAQDESNLDMDEETANYVMETLKSIPKELLIKKMLVRDFGNLKKSKNTADLNAPDRSAKRQDKKGSRNKKRDGSGRRGDRRYESSRSDRMKRAMIQNGKGKDFSAFTLNISSKVVSNKGHLLRLLCENSGLTKHHFGPIDLGRGDVVVTVDRKYAKQFYSRFPGTKVKGRKIKVRKEH